MKVRASFLNINWKTSTRFFSLKGNFMENKLHSYQFLLNKILLEKIRNECKKPLFLHKAKSDHWKTKMKCCHFTFTASCSRRLWCRQFSYVYFFLAKQPWNMLVAVLWVFCSWFKSHQVYLYYKYKGCPERSETMHCTRKRRILLEFFQSRCVQCFKTKP